MNIELVTYTPRGELVIENAMRVCHGGVNDTDIPNKKFIQNIIALGHESPLEHASATFLISGVSRSLSHQLVRHRIASPTQKSQRYVKESNFEYVVPDSIKEKGLADVFEKQMNTIQGFYDYWIEQGILRQDARYVLPNACTTTLYFSANLREWRNIIKLRSDKHAQWEIREMSNRILFYLYEIYPIIFEDLVRKFINLSETTSDTSIIN